ncbi:UNKNOWN [Stylonychia lemnae]|uniref:Uncharacterized protein n=1 Tax=Stylonychia lemnae TaxID=5949 RepID=A0A078AH27_STYLE|nr:UNKNOWN [Stylonychia lemnae]|eukprot:CDW80822.1 UNKNOWN [Stylonychia lemnae]
MSDNIETELKPEIERQKNQIDQLTYQVSNLETENQALITKNQDLKDQLVVLDEGLEEQTLDIMGEILEMQKELVDITFGYAHIVSNSVGYEVPQDLKILIGGEFNNWERVPMIRISERLFIYKTKVMAGYKYKFNFLTSESTDTTLDYRQPVAYSIFNDGNHCNYKYAIKTSNPNGPESSYKEVIEKMPEFIRPETMNKYNKKLEELNEQLNQLQSTSPDFNHEKAEQLNIQDEESKIELVQNALRRNKYLFQLIGPLNEIQNYAIASQQMTLKDKTIEQLNSVQKERESIFLIISEIFAGRYVKNKDANPIYYLIIGFNKFTNKVIIMRIFDQNGLLISDSNGNYSFALQIDDTNFISDYQILTQKEQSDLINDIFTNNNHILGLKYEIDETLGFKQYIPLETNPAGIDFQNDYYMELSSGGFPTTVKNVNFGAVKTQAMRVGSEFNYINTPMIYIYTSEYSSTAINIFHIHLTDHSEKKQAFQALYIRDDQSASDFESFQQDQNGQIPRYKILIQQQKIIAVLYNGEKGVENLSFNEVKYCLGDLCQLVAVSPVQLLEQTVKFELKRIPLGLIVSLNQENQVIQDQPLFQIHTFCRANSHFDEWPGLLEVTTKSEKSDGLILKNGRDLAIPACAFADNAALQREYDYWNR